MKIINELKDLGKKICPNTEITGNTLSEVIDCIDKHIGGEAKIISSSDGVYDESRSAYDVDLSQNGKYFVFLDELGSDEKLKLEFGYCRNRDDYGKFLHINTHNLPSYVFGFSGATSDNSNIEFHKSDNIVYVEVDDDIVYVTFMVIN